MKRPFFNFLSVLGIAVIGILACIGFLLVMTQKKTLHYFGISSPNELGDMLGGTTGPIIGLFSAILVYISFREQYKANLQLSSSRDEENFRHCIELLKENLEKTYKDFYYYNPEDSQLRMLTGDNGILGYLDDVNMRHRKILENQKIVSREENWKAVAQAINDHPTSEKFCELLKEIRMYADFIASSENVSYQLRWIYTIHLQRYVIFSEDARAVLGPFSNTFDLADPYSYNAAYSIVENYSRSERVIEKINMHEFDLLNSKE